MALTKEQREALNTEMPVEFVKEREGYDGKTLSFVEGWHMIDEMNRIVGAGDWGYVCTVSQVWEGKNAKQNFAVTYIGHCVVTIGDCKIGDVGAGQGVARFPADAHEKAAKEAATDALKRCLKSLGRRMGLALYDKQQRHVTSGNADAAESDSERGGQKRRSRSRKEESGAGGDNAEVQQEVERLLAMVANAKSQAEKAAVSDACTKLWPRMNQEDRKRYTEALNAAKAKARSNEGT